MERIIDRRAFCRQISKKGHQSVGLWKISYVSIASAPNDVAEADVREICAVAGPHNARASITGILTFHSGRFAQILEGPESSLRSLMDRISADRRHHSLVIAIDRAIAARQFDQWSMAYRTPTQFIQDQIADFSTRA